MCSILIRWRWRDALAPEDSRGWPVLKETYTFSHNWIRNFFPLFSLHSFHRFPINLKKYFYDSIVIPLAHFFPSSFREIKYIPLYSVAAKWWKWNQCRATKSSTSWSPVCPRFKIFPVISVCRLIVACWTWLFNRFSIIRGFCGFFFPWF